MSSGVGSFTADYALGQSHSVETSPRHPRVVVTGGSGKLGRATVLELANHGYDVINLDLLPPPAPNFGGAKKYVAVDLTDMGQVMESLLEVDSSYKGIDAVVHLAAIPAPGLTTNSKLFQVNIMSTFNILEACRKLRITNLVLASSETLIGLPFNPHHPVELPITETSERLPQSIYSLTKLLGEVMGDQYARWDPDLKVVNLRFSNVMLPEDYKKFESWQDDPSLRSWNAWGYIDARDGAQAIRLSLTSKLIGHHEFIIANAETCMRMPNEDLIKAVFPNTQYIPTKGPNDTLLSIDKARKVLGYEPKYGWIEQAHAFNAGNAKDLIEGIL